MSNTPVPVSIAGDDTWAPCIHALPPPDNFELDVAMDWGPGSGTGSHSLATARGGVFHKGQPLVLAQHDVGPLIPHMPMFNVISIARASRKLVFAAGSVKASGKPVGATHGWFKMLACGFPFSTPLAKNQSNDAHSVFVGLSRLDVIRGLLEIRKQITKDAIKLVLLIVNPADGVKGIMSSASPFPDFDPIDIAIDAGLDLSNSIILSVLTEGKEPVVVKVGQSAAFGGAGFELSVTPSNMDVGFKVEGRVGAQKLEHTWENGTHRRTVESYGQVTDDHLDGVAQL